MKAKKTEAQKEKVLYLFRGPCGSGKSFVRNQMNLPTCGIDMANYKGDTIEERVLGPALFVQAHENDLVLWIEGIFAPDSPSMISLAIECHRQGRIIQHIVTFVDEDTTRARIAVSTPIDRHATRQMLANKYHTSFARALAQ